MKTIIVLRLESCNQIQEGNEVSVLLKNYLEEILTLVDSLTGKIVRLQNQLKDMLRFYSSFEENLLVFKKDGVYELIGCTPNNRLYKKVLDFVELTVMEDNFVSINEDCVLIERLVASLNQLCNFLSVKSTKLSEVKYVMLELDNFLFSNFEMVLRMDVLFNDLSKELNGEVCDGLKIQIYDSINRFGKMLLASKMPGETPASYTTTIQYDLEHKKLESVLGQLNDQKTIEGLQELLNDFFDSSKQIILQQVFNILKENEKKVSQMRDEIKEKFGKFYDKLEHLKKMCAESYLCELPLLDEILDKFCKLEELTNEEEVEKLQHLLNEFFSMLFLDRCNFDPIIQDLKIELFRSLNELVLKKQCEVKELELQEGYKEILQKLIQTMEHLESHLDEEPVGVVLCLIREVKGDNLNNLMIKEGLEKLEELITTVFGFSRNLLQEQKYQSLQDAFCVMVQESDALLEKFPSIVADIKNVKSTEQLKQLVEQVLDEMKKISASEKRFVVEKVESVISNLDGYLKSFVQEQEIPELRLELEKVNNLKDKFIQLKGILGKGVIRSEDYKVLLNKINCSVDELLKLPNFLTQALQQLNTNTSSTCYMCLLYNAFVLNYIIGKQIKILESNNGELNNTIKKSKERIRDVIKEELLYLLQCEVVYYPQDLQKLKEIRKILVDNDLIGCDQELVSRLSKLECAIGLRIEYVNAQFSVRDLANSILPLKQSIDMKCRERELLKQRLECYCEVMGQRVDEPITTEVINIYTDTISPFMFV
ncbi:MAG: hypothetical protein ACTJLM_00070 [Ehrlichia sp.]